MHDLPGTDSSGATRRAPGELESAVLEVLWDAAAPLSPGEVRDRLAAAGQDGGDGDRDVPAYSTVVTILTRLYEKKALTRSRAGRAFRYAPVTDEAGLAARRLAAMLDRTQDREAVLSRFVADLADGDEQFLRALLGGCNGETGRG